jgi:predicted transposase YbfD/YdcC
LKALPDFRTPFLIRHGLQVTFAALAWAHLNDAKSQRQKEAYLKGETWVELREVFESLGFECSPTPPSDSTLQRIVKMVDHKILADIVAQLNASLPRTGATGLPNLYAIDGKARKAAITDTGKNEIDVSIYDVGTKVAVAKLAVGAKEGEAPVARELFESVASGLEKGYISADAGIACREFAATVEKCEHDFLCIIKGNAGKIHDEMQSLPWQDAQRWTSAEKGHGRMETRATELLRLDVETMERVIPSAKMYPAGLVFGSITRTREDLKTLQKSEERTFFLLSEREEPLTAQVGDALVRGHWCIENELHRHRDVELGEDDLPRMSSQASRVIGSILDLAGWLAGGVGRGIRYFMQQLRASSVRLFQRWLLI